jgi:hypothetical protein
METEILEYEWKNNSYAKVYVILIPVLGAFAL